VIYELRVYRCMPGRKADVLTSFREHTMAIFKKHGLEVVGFWDTVVGDTDDVLYLMRYSSWEDRERRWAAFMADPEWHKERDRSRAHGMIVESIKTVLLQATDFSPSM
jgi:hypothetical protein